jgi:hypothetical protein
MAIIGITGMIGRGTMVEETEYHPSSTRKGPKVGGSADVQTLIHSIIAAHQTGALFFLAVQLAPILEEHCQKNRAITPLELETLIAQATKVMMSE